MNVETRIRLDKFKPRDYQIPILDSITHKNYKRVLAIWPRRAGKDIVGFNIVLRKLLEKVGIYYYVLPTFAQGRKILWDGITNDGQKIIDFIPKELIESINNSEMKIKFVNGSLFQVIGSDTYDNTLVGTNPRGIVFSEYALQDPRAYQFVRPILAANDGWALFLSTPRGHNSLYELYNIAIQSEDWYVSKLTVDDTQHISLHQIQKDRAEGLMSEDLIQQEYYTSFDMGVEGSYYSKYLDRMRLNRQIGDVPYEIGFKVHTAWDLGMADQTTIIFFQTIGQTVRIIDCYENNGSALNHYAKVLEQKGYTYGKHIGPHDIRVRELGTGQSRLEMARQLGISFDVAPNLPIEDGIECVRANMSKIWIDSQKCLPLIKALESYRQEYDSRRKVYKGIPLHDWSSHFSDCMRYLCISLPKTKEGSGKGHTELREEYLYPQGNLPSFFRDNFV